MKYDNSKTIKLSLEHIARVEEMGDKYGMNDSEIARLGIDMLFHFEKKGELMKIMQKLLEKLGGDKDE